MLVLLPTRKYYSKCCHSFSSCCRVQSSFVVVLGCYMENNFIFSSVDNIARCRSTLELQSGINESLDRCSPLIHCLMV